jgi:transposase InsO family protein
MADFDRVLSAGTTTQKKHLLHRMVKEVRLRNRKWLGIRLSMRTAAGGRKSLESSVPGQSRSGDTACEAGQAGASDVTDLLERTIAETGVEHVEVRHRPRLLSDNGPCFVSRELARYLKERELRHTRGQPYHPMTQGKIERYHRSLKNVIKLRNYYLPWELEREIARFIRYYNHERVHEALDNLTPADVYEGRGRDIQTARHRLKQQTLERRRRFNLGLRTQKEDLILPSRYRGSVS